MLRLISPPPEEKEETQNARLVPLEEDAAYFEGITFRRAAPGRLEIFVAMQQQDGSLGELHFAYTNAKR